MSSPKGMSRVQKELLELREKGLTTNQRDKYKDLTGAVTTPEEAAAFLAAMRDKSRTGARVQPPANLSADGYDAWFLQQKEREREMKRKRQEAEALLHGYRSSLSHQKLQVKDDGKDSLEMPPAVLYEDGEELEAIGEHDSWVAFDETEFSEGIGKIDLSAFDSHNIDGAEPDLVAGTVFGKASSENRVAFEDFLPSGTDCSTPTNDKDEKKTDEADHKPRKKEKPVPTPAKHLLPDETEWREWVSSTKGARFPAESGRYHLYVSFADPGSHRVLIIRALKGLEDAISVTVVHPTWRRTRPDDPDDGHRGWIFGDPGGDPFTNTAGRGGPFPASYPGTDPDPIFNAYSIKEIYENAGDTAKRYTVPVLWDKKKSTIVNNESSDIAYMLNSRFNEFAKNAELDLYTEAEEEKLDEIDDWIQPLMINGVYRCGFAKTQDDYEKAITELTNAFDKAESILEKQRFLAGDTLTDVDVRLFVSLFRFDEVYAFYFKTNTRLVMLSPTLLNYCRDIFQMERIAETCDMEQIKAHFFGSHAELNKFSIIPRGLGFTKLLNETHDRVQL